MLNICISMCTEYFGKCHDKFEPPLTVLFLSFFFLFVNIIDLSILTILFNFVIQYDTTTSIRTSNNGN